MRDITIPEIQARFDIHRKLHDFEVNELFFKGKRNKANAIQLRYLQVGIRYQGIWDIETTDFNPLGNFMICYSFIRRDIVTGKLQKFSDHITKKDIEKGVKNDSFSFDERILQTLAKHMASCEQVVGHYSSKFDFPYFRVRCLLTKQPELIPSYGTILQGDTWRMMKNTLKAPRNTLGNLAVYTGLKNEKTYVDMEHWKRIFWKDSKFWKKSMGYITYHCDKDTSMTFKALLKIEKFNNVSMSRN